MTAEREMIDRDDYTCTVTTEINFQICSCDGNDAFQPILFKFPSVHQFSTPPHYFSKVSKQYLNLLTSCCLNPKLLHRLTPPPWTEMLVLPMILDGFLEDIPSPPRSKMLTSVTPSSTSSSKTDVLLCLVSLVPWYIIALTPAITTSSTPSPTTKKFDQDFLWCSYVRSLLLRVECHVYFSLLLL